MKPQNAHIFPVEPINDNELVVGQEFLIDWIIPDRFDIAMLRTATTKPHVAIVSGDAAKTLRIKNIQYLQIVSVSEISGFGKAVNMYAPSLDPKLWKQIVAALDCSESCDPYREEVWWE